MEQTESHKMPIMGHLEELRNRLLRIAGVLLVACVVGLIFSKPIYRFLAIPMQHILQSDGHFISTSPLEAFLTYMRTGFVAGVFLSVPVIFYEIWQFVTPALYRSEKKGSLFFVAMTSIFFIGGALFGYFIVFPTSFRFFVALLAGSDIQFLPKMSEYFSFTVRLLFAFGIVFELPVIILLLSRIGVITVVHLRKARPYAVVGVFIVAGLMTGPDVASQFLMALPLMVLFEFGIILAKLFGKKK